MKNKYIAMYKCQMCQLRFSKQSDPIELEESDVFMLMGKIIAHQQFVGTNLYDAPIKIPHRCWNGNIGYCDLIGFKKIKEKKHK